MPGPVVRQSTDLTESHAPRPLPLGPAHAFFSIHAVSLGLCHRRPAFA